MKILCSILTPERQIYEGEIDSAIIQVHDGEWGFLPNHTPFISKLGIGEVRLKSDGEVEFFFVDGGYIEMRENRLSLLAEKIIKKNELVKEEIEEKIKILKGNISRTRKTEERVKQELILKKEKAKLKIANR